MRKKDIILTAESNGISLLNAKRREKTHTRTHTKQFEILKEFGTKV